MLFDAYDNIRIINLAHRTDRRAEMMRELARVGLDADPKVSFFNACTFTDAGTFESRGARGCFHSHLEILDEAAKSGASVLILEDDLDFAREVSSFELQAAPPIFYGAYSASKPDDLPNSDIAGSHFMGFDAPTAARLAAYLRSILASGKHPPIDGAYVWFRRAHPEVRTVFAPVPLGHQRPSRTDIAPLRFYDRVPGIRNAMPIARRLRQRFRGRTSPGLVATGAALCGAALGFAAGARISERSKDAWP